MHVSPYFRGSTRLGNIMFQIAAAYAHSLRYDYECCIPWNCHWCSKNLRWFLRDSPVDLPEISWLEEHCYISPYFNYRKIPEWAHSGSLMGWFQSWKYFEDYKDNIKQLYKPFILKDNKENAAGIHIRLGDYKWYSNIYNVSSDSFLVNAAQYILPEIDRLVLFSDVPREAYARLRMLPAYNRFEIEIHKGSDFSAIQRMTSMQELIMSCSTFSWWGAYLGDIELVMIPKKWFVSEPAYYYKDVYCKHWIRL